MESTQPTPLDRYLLTFKRRWLPAAGAFATVMVLTALAASVKKPVYVAEGTIKLERVNPTSSLTGVGKEIGSIEPLVERGNPLATEAEVVRSVPVVQSTIAQLNLENSKGKPLTVKEFLARLTVRELRGTDLLEVTYQATDPVVAAQIVNTLINRYLENNVLSRRAAAIAVRQFIEKQLPEAEGTVQQAEANLRRFREKNNVIALSEETTATLDSIQDLQKKMTETRTQLADVDAQANLLRKQLGGSSQQAVVTTSLSQSPDVQDVLQQVRQAETELIAERNRLQSNHPKVISLENKLSDLKRLLDDRVSKVMGSQAASLDRNRSSGELQQDLTKELVLLESKRDGLANQISSLSNAQANYQQRSNVLPELEQEQRQLQRKLEAAQSTYSVLLQKLQEVRVAENQNVGNAHIIAAAQVPDLPNSSSGFYLAGAFLGLLAAGATTYVLEARDKSIKTIEQAKTVLGYPVAGEIPILNKSQKSLLLAAELERYRRETVLRSTPEVIVQSQPRAATSAAYRMLHANLKFLNSDKLIKTIVVASSVPKEGKSTISSNLAMAIAQSGRRVLLVDADFHRPIQHRIWNLQNDLGLSHLIIGRPEARRIIQPVFPNLDVLTSGVLPPNPTALLDSQRMAALMESFSSNYDFVIIDTPPLTMSADAPILGKLADGVLLVVRLGGVDYSSAVAAKQLLERSSQPLLGMVINGVSSENKAYSDYYLASEYYIEEGTAGGRRDS